MRKAETQLENKEGKICRQYTMTGLTKKPKNIREINIYELSCMQIPEGESVCGKPEEFTVRPRLSEG
jgi:hypothetical protein